LTPVTIASLVWNHSRVATRSWQQASVGFQPRPWREIREFVASMAARDARFAYLVDIVDSVLAAGQSDALCATTSMHDLIVVPAPVPDPPFDVIAVRAPGSLHAPAAGKVLIEHLSLTGRDDRIERPTVEAIPLFWRFIIEKFGITPDAHR
jgi:hypothetical protein